MSEYDSELNTNSIQNTGETADDNLDDTVGAANNSIIGKVKSRVSSIIPNRLSKWFSPSSNRNNDSVNGNLSEGGGGGRRRRRIEIEAGDDEELEPAEYNSRLNQREDISDEDSNISVQDNSDDDDEVNNRERVTAASKIYARPSLNSSSVSRPPPAKRSRLNMDTTVTRDYPLMSHQPLFASTPAVSSHSRNTLLNAVTDSPPVKIGHVRTNRSTHLNLYGHQAKKEAAYNFIAPGMEEVDVNRRNATTDDDLRSHQTSIDGFEHKETGTILKNNISSRRSLNIPSTCQPGYTDIAELKRQPLTSMKQDMPSTSRGIKHGGNVIKSVVLPMRTSTTILEIEGEDENGDDKAEDDDDDDNDDAVEVINTTVQMKNQDINERTDAKYNGRSPGLAMNKKRQKLINGRNVAEFNLNNTDMGNTSSESSEYDRSDRGDGRNIDITSEGYIGLHRKPASLNINPSRTPSMSNGLNFNTHLEGRKSLFASTAQGRGNQTTAGGNLHNSTLSLSSLNRRQFNSSIYSSMSALSDSRLLNTFSPFYKGRTTYGGAAAYNKYTTGVGASAVRITPTLIRPTSSLSTLSSSSNSLAANAGAAVGTVGEGSSAISSTAKRILDLINDFATPLSEAKKMANNLKTNQQQQHLLLQKQSRLTDADLRAQRAVRLSQVRTPYMRPAVILQAKHTNDKKTTLLPPTRELQVPSMSQLLQMKKMQNTTEFSRRIATERSNNETSTLPYTLPNENGSDKSEQQQKQQKHTNKLTRTSKYSMDNDIPHAPINLPNIAFPLMKSVPKIDIPIQNIVKSQPTPILTTTISSTKCNDTFAFNTIQTVKAAVSPKSGICVSLTSPETIPTIRTIPTIPTTNFEFSEPLELKCAVKPTQNTIPMMTNFQFCAPVIIQDAVTVHTSSRAKDDTNGLVAMPTTPKLKTGSVLDFLSKPFTLPKTASTVIATSTMTTTPMVVSDSVSVSGNQFGGQFKKASNEWECDVCMIRNKNEISKCVACSAPRKQSALIKSPATTLTTSTAATTSTSNFGGQFKKSDNEWDCEICLVRNKMDSSKCLACEAPRKQIDIVGTTSLNRSITNPVASSNSFGSQFNKPTNEWECDTCMIRNKDEVSKCIACETPRKGGATAVSLVIPTIVSKNSFGSAFKQTPNTWECPTCLIMNKNEVCQCIACETNKPGAPKTTISINKAASTADNTFKSIAASQTASKWECEACMTRNDASRSKCVCCEQAKPGIESPIDNQPKFSFGATAAAKFHFGFGGAGGAKESDLHKAEAQKTESRACKGFIFGNTSKPDASTTSTSFTFGIKPITSEANKDEADSNNKPKTTSTFTFGSTSNTNAITTSSTASNLIFGAVPTTETINFKSDSIQTSANTTAVATTATLSTVKFAIPLATTTTATTSTKTTTSEVVSSTTGTSSTPTFSFGTTPTAVMMPPSTALTFGIPLNKTSTTTTTTTTTTPTVSVTATPAAAAAKVMFSFSKPSVPSQTVVSAETTKTATTEGIRSFSFTSNDNGIAKASTFSVPATITATTNASNTSSSENTSFGSNVEAVKPAFGAASSVAKDKTTTTTANVFGSFGAPAGFGETSNVITSPSANTIPTKSVGPSKFGSFGAAAASTSSTNIFGSFGQSDAKPTAKATAIFGSPAASNSNSTATPQDRATSFVFGVPQSVGTVASASTNASHATTTTTTTTSTWPKISFAFGGASDTTSSENVAGAAESSTKPSFGAFGSPAAGASGSGTSAAAPASIFGNITAVSSAPTFDNTATASATSIFGSTSAPAIGSAQQTNAFGSIPFGSTASASANAVPTFGSVSAAPSTFGGFATEDGASAPKKSDTTFIFGANAANTSSSRGFNFGTSAAAKPAFNFTAKTNAPTFNFTGATEATPNAPFQFNAGVPPASNIFAPTPTPASGQNVQQQQAKRKIRPIRRLPPR